jgi:hypothetical protein
VDTLEGFQINIELHESSPFSARDMLQARKQFNSVVFSMVLSAVTEHHMSDADPMTSALLHEAVITMS